nr:hypothetical protein [Spirochaetaceae bacterium]
VADEDLAEYRIYRGLTATSLSVLTNTLGLNYSDSSLTPSTSYYYAVSAVDASGNESEISDAVSATTDEAQPVSLKVKMSNTGTSSQTNSIGTKIQVVNESGESVDLSRVTIRYYLTSDSSTPLSYWCDYAGGPISSGWDSITSAVSGEQVTMVTPTSLADCYMEIGFTSAAGTLKDGGYAEIQSRFTKSDWSNMDQSNDYSFNETATSPIEWNKVVLCVDDVIVWGETP